MKHLSALCLAAALTGLSVQPADAQQSAELGILGGLGYNTVSGDGITSQDGRVGFMAGGFLKYSFSPLIALTLEAQYAVKGTKAAQNSDGDVADLKFTYLDTPVLLVVTAAAGSTMGFDFYAGWSMNYRLSCGYAPNGSNMSDCENPWMQGDKVEWSIPAGIALAYKFGGGTFYVDARYLLGLSDVLEGVAAKNRGFQGFVKLGFPIY